jgi:hypothetical protein
MSDSGLSELKEIVDTWPRAGELAKAHLLHTRDLIDTVRQKAERAAISRVPGRAPSLIIRPRGRL